MSATDNRPDTQGVADYCRQIESYLCQKNGGHLVRVVGPAFEQVRTWAEQGIPLKIAFRGIDQCCERRAAKGPQRRPVRIEFCASDILELFDAWRRAVGVGAAEEPAPPVHRKPSLASHVERAVARLIALRDVHGGAPLPAGAIDTAVESLDRVGERAREARGDEREALVEELLRLDDRLVALAAGELDAARARALRLEAEEELAPFTLRMQPAARTAAIESAYLRLVRESVRLPRIRFD